MFLKAFFVLAALFAVAAAQNYVQQTYYSGSGCSTSVGAIQIANPQCWADASEKYSCDQSGNYVRYGCDDSACNVCTPSETVTAVCEVYTPRNTDSVDKRCSPLPSSYPTGSVIITTYPSDNCQGVWGRRAVYAPNFCLGGVKYTCSGDSITMTTCTDTVNCASGCTNTPITAGCLGTGMFQCYTGGNIDSAPQTAPVAAPSGSISAPTSSNPAPLAAPVAAPVAAPTSGSAPSGAGNAPSVSSAPKSSSTPVRSPFVGTPSSSSIMTAGIAFVILAASTACLL